TLPDHLATNRPQKAKVRGTVAPANGMQQLIDGLQSHLENAGVEFDFNQDSNAQAGERAVVCLSARAAAEYLAQVAPALSSALREIEMLSIVTVTCFYGSDAAKLNGFGCLFPRDQGFRARGVLSNDSIFEGRGPAHAETWIFGGALDADVVDLSDQAVADIIASERERFYGAHNEPI